MIENKELGLKIAENSDEKFWIETKEKCIEGIEIMKRNIKINQNLVLLCNEQLDAL